MRAAYVVMLLVVGAGAAALSEACARSPTFSETKIASVSQATGGRLTAPPSAVLPNAAPVLSVERASASEQIEQVGSEPCEGSQTSFVVSEPAGPLKHFSVHGYLARTLRVTREFGSRIHAHCITIAWPSGGTNSAGAACGVAQTIDDGWLRAIANTLLRVPFRHAKLLRRIVIDNRPTEHGIAPFNRNRPDDARDGHTIWLHERLFREPNHWARGNYGAYFSYHVNQDGVTLDDLAAHHDFFSPVLLHELGHLVMYHLVNTGADRLTAPVCAQNCVDAKNCNQLSQREREAGCISPYCVPFRFKSATENWAEQYRFFYQASSTRELLATAQARCLPVLSAEDSRDGQSAEPWARGLPDMKEFRRSHWDSCGGRECKPF